MNTLNPVKKTRETYKCDRNRIIFERYHELIREEPKAHLLPKSHFYESLSTEFFITAQTISRIISSQMRSAKPVRL